MLSDMSLRKRPTAGGRGMDDSKKLKLDFAEKAKGAVSKVDEGNLKKKTSKLSRQLKWCLQIIRKLLDEKYNKITWPFLKPVDVHGVQSDDHTVINPMDLQTIKTKLENQKYSTPQEFEADFRLIFTNCHNYDASVCEYATELQKVFDELYAKMPDEHVFSAFSAVTRAKKEDAPDNKSEEYIVKSIKELRNSTSSTFLDKRRALYDTIIDKYCENGLEANEEMEKKMIKGSKGKKETTEAVASPSIQLGISDSTEASMPPLECARQKPQQLASTEWCDDPTVVQQEKKQGLGKGFRAVKDQLHQTVKKTNKVNGSEFEQRRQLSDISNCSIGSESAPLLVSEREGSTNSIQRTDPGRGRQLADSYNSECSSLSSPSGDSVKKWTRKERKRLAKTIRWLPMDKVHAIVHIIDSEEGPLERSGPDSEVEIDFEALKHPILTKLEKYVNTQCHVKEPSHITMEDGGRQREEGKGWSVSSPGGRSYTESSESSA